MTSSIGSTRQYTFDVRGEMRSVAGRNLEEAARIDVNGDGVLQESELAEAIHDEDCCHGKHHSTEDPGLMKQFKIHLEGKPNALAASYHSYQQATDEMRALAEKYPNLCETVSLGKTSEGRDILALRISENVGSPDTAKKPGVVITGCHHAREWMSVECPLHLSHELVEKFDSDPAIKKRVQDAEIWVIPIANPDGYEYSRETDNWWRKNRRPVVTDAMGKPTKAIGVDLNRNYWDGKAEHFELYRPKGDTPGSTFDDFSQTSDRPSSDTYRGPSGASELETKALLNLELGHANVKGVIDHHSYSEMILYPWGHTSAPCEKEAVYKAVGQKINDAMGGDYKLQQSAGLYPCSGESDDCHHANDILSFTFEVGKSFQPEASEIAPMCEKVARGNMAFIDEIIARNPVAV
jgi:carboxypeptidase T